MPSLAFLTDPVLRDGLQTRLQRVETRLNKAVKSSYPFVTETSAHLVEAGGKRFRPLMTLLCADFGDADTDQVQKMARRAIGIRVCDVVASAHGPGTDLDEVESGGRDVGDDRQG